MKPHETPQLNQPNPLDTLVGEVVYDDSTDTVELPPHVPQALDLENPLATTASHNVVAEVHADTKTFLILDIRQAPQFTLDGNTLKDVAFGDVHRNFNSNIDFLLVSDEIGSTKGRNAGLKGIRHGENVTIGREHHTDRFDYTDHISRDHFSVQYSPDGQLLVTDLGSTNKTRLTTKKPDALDEPTKPASDRIIRKNTHLDTTDQIELPQLIEAASSEDITMIQNVLSEFNHIRQVAEQSDGFQISPAEIEARLSQLVGNLRTYAYGKDPDDAGKNLIEAAGVGFSVGASQEQATVLTEAFLQSKDLADKEKQILHDFWLHIRPLQARLTNGEIPRGSGIVEGEVYRAFYGVANQLQAAGEQAPHKTRLLFAAAGTALSILPPNSEQQSEIIQILQTGYPN